MSAHKFSMPEMVWWMGVVEDRTTDPKMLGRVKVRIFGYHSAQTSDISTDQLMWAVVMQPITSAAISGKGTTPLGFLEGSTVFGFFLDGSDAQTPIIIGSYGAIPEKDGAVEDGDGFKDPNGKYPSYPPGEQDTNRLARHEKIDETIVQPKKDHRDLQVPVAMTNPIWDQPETPYAAKYPYNHVRETESGHVQELDDTEGAERLSQWHRAETWWEIGPDGTQVEVFQKDKYKVVIGNEFVHVKGDVDVTVDGNVRLLVKGNYDVEVLGNKRELIHGNSHMQVNGNYDVMVKGNWRDWSTTHRSIDAPRVDENLPTPPPEDIETNNQ